MKFNPIDECVAAEQQRKKKAAIPRYKGRAKCLTTVVLKDLPSTIPKGGPRDKLKEAGRVKELCFRRILSEKEVNTLILEGFQGIKLSEFEYLQCKDGSLVVAEKQKLNGNEVIMLAGCGCLYLYELTTSNVQQLISNAKRIIERVKVRSLLDMSQIITWHHVFGNYRSHMKHMEKNWKI